MGSASSEFTVPDLMAREDDEGDGPKAYLNYLVFDSNLNFLDGGFARVSTAAREDGSTLGSTDEGIDHELLTFDKDIVIKEPGYVYIYYSNESETNVEVYFDDFTVEHVHGKVVQQEDYYPFGLSYNEYQRESATPNMYQYNGKELQDELDLGWLDYGARMYMPDIGRWGMVDPQVERYYAWSSYNYTLNNPVVYVDPDGEFVGTLVGLVVGGVAGAIKSAVKGENVWRGATEGAIAGGVAGAFIDAGIATGGAAWVVVGAAAVGGGVGAVLGDIAGQGAESLSNGNSLSESVSLDNKDYSKTLQKAATGATIGLVAGGVGVGISAAIKSVVSSSTEAAMSSMSTSITETAETLNAMGANAATTQGAVDNITQGMANLGRNVTQTTSQLEAVSTTAIETTSQVLQSTGDSGGGGAAIEQNKLTYPPLL